jgi:hypothetical protein
MSNPLEERLQRLGERLPELDEATLQRVQERVGPPRRWRRWPRVALAVPVVAAAVALAVLLWPSSGPDVLARAYAALAVPPHSILHARIVTTNSFGCRQVTDSWVATDRPYWYRNVTTGASRSDDGWVHGRAQFYDPARDVVVQGPRLPVIDAIIDVPPSLDFARTVRRFLAQGKGRLVGKAVIAGHDVYRIAVPAGDAKPLIIAVDTRTFEPVRFVRRLPFGGGSTSTTVLWRYVPDTPANHRLLDVAAQHPGVRVERTPTLRAYNMAETRAAGSECGS